MVVDGQKPDVKGQKTNIIDKGKKVSFAADVKPPAPNGAQENQEKKDGAPDGVPEGAGAKPAEEKKLDGVIGQLEVHRSGIIKMRLGNGMLMDVHHLLYFL
jgi:DNA-directed RNA polymerase III subunit RPC4